MQSQAPIYVAGHRGLVGSAIWRELQRRGFTRLLGRTHAELDLMDSAAVKAFFQREKPEHVFVAAAKVGGIHANDTYQRSSFWRISRFKTTFSTTRACRASRNCFFWAVRASTPRWRRNR